jgi:uncharacterized repeat protein (TIGR01451 family)
MRRLLSLAVAAATLAALAPVLVMAALPAAAQAATSSQNGTLYLAEGNTLAGWNEFITILNPSSTETATVAVTYACEKPAGTKVSCGIAGDTVTRTVAPLTRDTITVNDPAQGGVNGVFTGVGATLRFDSPVVAERPMYMEQPQGAFSQIPAVLAGAHDARAVAASTLWYLPEGTTQSGFQQYLTLLNPGTDTVKADITYSIEGGSVVTRTRDLPPESRTTIDVVDPSSPGALGQQVVGLSTIVTGSGPIVVERPLYFDHDFGGGVGLVNGATDKPGARFAQADPGRLIFAEGNGLPDFEEYITVLNTENRAGTLSISYLVEGQTAPVARTCPIAALARLTIDVSQTGQSPCSLGRENAGSTVAKGIGADLSADVAIAAERPMYFVRDFPEIGTTNGAHDVFGLALPQEQASTFYFAEGSTRTGFDQFWTITNPNATDIVVAVDYLYQPGQGRTNETKQYSVPRNSRVTVQVFNPANGGVGRNGDTGYDFGAKAFSIDGSPFEIERPFYTRRSINGIVTDDGHDIAGATPQEVFGETTGGGVPRLALSKASAQTQTPAGDEITFTLTVSNPGSAAVNGVVVSDSLPAGSGVARSDGGAASGGTVTFAVGDLSAGSTVTRSIVVTTTVTGVFTNQASAQGANAGPVHAQASVLVTPAPPSARPRPAFHLDDGVDWGELDDIDGNGVGSGGDEVTETLRIANGLPGQAGYTRDLVATQPFLSGTERVITESVFGGQLGDDDFTNTILPFTFPFFGVPYDVATVSSNGWAAFGTAAEDYWDDSQNTDFRGPAYVVSQFYRGVMPNWEDLVLDQPPALLTEVIAPDLSAVAFQWEVSQCCPDPPVRNFEVVLFADGRIRFDYRGNTAPSNTANPSFQGISGGTGLSSLDVIGLNVTDTPAASVLYTPNPLGPVAPAPPGTVTASIPAGTEYVRGDARCLLTVTPTASTDGMVTCAAPLLAAGASDLFTIVWTTPADDRNLAFDGAWHTDALVRYDSDELALAGVPELESNYPFTKTVDDPTPPPASEVTFTIAAKANTEFINPVLTDTLPDGYTFVRSSFENCTANGQAIECRPLSGFSDYSGTIVATGTVPAGTIATNTAGWRADNATEEGAQVYVGVPPSATRTAVLRGENETPPNDLTGTGEISVTIDINAASVCYSVSVTDVVLPAAAAHIHQAVSGTAGPVVIPFPTAPDATGTATGCTTAPVALLADIVNNPRDYYVNIHTTDFPGGAVRGQLGFPGFATFSGSGVVICPSSCFQTSSGSANLDDEASSRSGLYNENVTVGAGSPCQTLTGTVQILLSPSPPMAGTLKPGESYVCGDLFVMNYDVTGGDEPPGQVRATGTWTSIGGPVFSETAAAVFSFDPPAP